MAIPVPYDRQRFLEVAAATKARNETTQDAVVDAIREAILEDVFPPGTRLRQEDLATAFGTSRIPVREALRVLEYEGLVKSQAHRGFEVRALEAHEVEEIYELRILLESYALQIAVPLLTEEDVDELSRLFEAMEATEDRDLSREYREAFFLRLYRVTARPRLIGLIARLRREAARSPRWKFVQNNPPDHRVFFEAVRAGDANLAVSELASHNRRISSLLQRFIRESDQTAAPAR